MWYDTHAAIDTDGLLTLREALSEHRFLERVLCDVGQPSTWDEATWLSEHASRVQSPAYLATLDPVTGDERDTSVDRIGSVAQGCTVYQFCMPSQPCPAHRTTRLVCDGSGTRFTC